MKNNLFVPLLLIVTVLLLIATALLSYRKGIHADTNRFITTTKPVIDTSRYAVFSVHKVPDMRFNHRNNIKLLSEDLITVDNKLNEFVASYNSKSADTIYIEQPKNYYIQPRGTLRLAHYNRQCAGFIDSNGRKIILVNCICDNASENWRKNFSLVYGGGACYFRILVDVTNNVIIESGVNSPK